MEREFKFHAGVTLVGGGALGSRDIALALGRAPHIVAADGGAGPVLRAGHVPEWVIGDMDSLSAGARMRVPQDRLVEVAEQDSTDFEKCLARIDAPLTLGVGFLGRRIDHQMAAMSALVRRAGRIVLIGRHDVVAALPPRAVTIDLRAGTRVSLFPMRPVSGRSDGLRWPVDGIGFQPQGPVGTSNVATGPVRIAMTGTGMLVILPRAALDPLLEGLGSVSRADW